MGKTDTLTEFTKYIYDTASKNKNIHIDMKLINVFNYSLHNTAIACICNRQRTTIYSITKHEKTTSAGENGQLHGETTA